ncbi:MAG: AraC family transcriptional regulator, partial [Flavobacterium haoranii]
RFDENLLLDSNSPIAPTVEYIRQNITENINIKDLSDKACMSSTSFYRYFKRELGVTPVEFILNEKIKFAKKLLKNPGIQINEVSFASGFEDSNYFIRLFKKYEGVTPKQYQLMNFTR